MSTAEPLVPLDQEVDEAARTAAEDVELLCGDTLSPIARRRATVALTALCRCSNRVAYWSGIVRAGLQPLVHVLASL